MSFIAYLNKLLSLIPSIARIIPSYRLSMHLVCNLCFKQYLEGINYSQSRDSFDNWYDKPNSTNILATVNPAYIYVSRGVTSMRVYTVVVFWINATFRTTKKIFCVIRFTHQWLCPVIFLHWQRWHRNQSQKPTLNSLDATACFNVPVRWCYM